MFGLMTVDELQIWYRDLAAKAYIFSDSIPKVPRQFFNRDVGKCLFQQSKIDEIARIYIHDRLENQPTKAIAAPWNIVLATRLLFARDYLLSLCQHVKSPAIPNYDEEEVLCNLVLTTWKEMGLEWLLLHRGGIRVAETCGDRELCESTRWAMKEYREYETWNVTPGIFSTNEEEYT